MSRILVNWHCFFARAAEEFGYDFTAKELEAEFKTRQEAGIEVIDGAEMDDEELEHIAGGQCAFSDECDYVLHYYKHDPECSSTYRWSDACIFDDGCLTSINFYDGHPHLSD